MKMEVIDDMVEGIPLELVEMVIYAPIIHEYGHIERYVVVDTYGG